MDRIYEIKVHEKVPTRELAHHFFVRLTDDALQSLELKLRELRDADAINFSDIKAVEEMVIPLEQVNKILGEITARNIALSQSLDSSAAQAGRRAEEALADKLRRTKNGKA
jgi:hypothetical protein